MADHDSRNFLVRATLLKERIDDAGQFPFTIPAIGALDVSEFQSR